MHAKSVLSAQYTAENKMQNNAKVTHPGFSFLFFRSPSNGESTTSESSDDDAPLFLIQQLQRQVNSKRYVSSGGTRVKATNTLPIGPELNDAILTQNNVIESSSTETESDFNYDDSDRDPDYKPENKKKKSFSEDIAQLLPRPGHVESNQSPGASVHKESIIPQVPLVTIQERGRKRKRLTPEERRCRDDAVRNQRMAKKQNIKAGCSEKCKLKCQDNFTMERRIALNTQFWSLQWSHRRAFVQQRINKTAVKRRRVSADTSRRLHTFVYHLPNEQGDNILVCRKMFEDTLNIGDKVVQNALNNESLDDKRGKHTPAHAVDHNIIKADVERYHPCRHHYRREHAPLRRYLPSDVSITDMHETFNASRQSPVSYALYYKVFKEMNISMAQLGNEECEMCQTHSIHMKGGNCPNPCDICHRQEEHKSRATHARQAYQADATNPHMPDECIVSADMQKVIMLPRMEMFKTVLFTRRICLFNETFAAVGSKKKQSARKNNVACLWHEGIMGRKDEDIASTFWEFISENRDFAAVTIWLDNCAGQNKNWTLFTVMATAVNSDSFNVSRITLKYFEKGHTFMSADSAHAEIEDQLRKAKQVFDFKDFVGCVEKTSCKAIQMKSSCFRQWVSGTSQYKLRQSDDRPILANVSSAQFRRGSRNLFYKNSHTSDFLEFSFIKKDFVLQEKPAYKGPRGVSQAKKDDILKKLLPLMPGSRRAFWQDLTVSEAADNSD